MYPQVKPPQQPPSKNKNQLKFANILEEQFVSLIVGKPGSGKSYLITQLLTDKNFYYEYFDLILLITPSNFENIKFDKNICNSELNELWIRQKLDELQSKLGPKINKTVLIVLDDVVSQLEKSVKFAGILQLFYNRRHIHENMNISYIITTQKYTVCPLKIRNIVTNVILFDINSSEYKTIKQELLYQSDKNIDNIVQQQFKQQHNFIYIRLNPYKLHLNFKPFEV